MANLSCNICGKTFLLEKIYRNGRTTCSKECRSILRKNTNLAKYGAENVSQSTIIKQKKKDTFLKNYGIDHYFKSPQFFENRKTVCLEKYGVEHHSKSDYVKTKKKETMVIKYGIENPSQFEEFQQKKKDTFIKKYGVDHPLRSNEIQKIKKENYLKNHGVEHPKHLSIDEVSYKKLNDPKWLLEKNKTLTSVEIGDELGVSYGMVLSFFKKHNIEYIRHNYSVIETEIFNFVKSLAPTAEQSVRKIIGKELDIFVPAYNLAIEYNGSYWHSEIGGNKDRLYHLDKTRKCKDKNIRLIHIWEYNWDKKDIIYSMISSAMGVTDKRLYARKCILGYVDKNLEKTFLENNHIQGYTTSQYCYGLYHNNELVSIIEICKR
jgi:hypothetical protein